MLDAASYDAAGAADISDPADASAAHVPVKKLTIGSWNLTAKYDEHVLLSFYWAERKLVWEVLHLGVVRKMEVDFEDVLQVTHSASAEDAPDKLLIELHRPPRFFKENPPSALSAGGAAAQQEVNYVYTTDFTNGQASTESRHVLLFDPGAISRELTKMMSGSGLRLVSEGLAAGGGGVLGAKGAAGLKGGAGLLRAGAGGVHATAAHLRQPPTSSPRLDAILLQDQLKREMRERQARYTGICPVRERIYAAVFDELVAAIGRDSPKTGSLLRRVFGEARLSIDAYRSVFGHSTLFGDRKLSQSKLTKGDLAGAIEAYEMEISGLKTEVAYLADMCESLEAREAERELSYEERPQDVLDLEAEQQQLRDLLAALLPSKPEKGK